MYSQQYFCVTNEITQHSCHVVFICGDGISQILLHGCMFLSCLLGGRVITVWEVHKLATGGNGDRTLLISAEVGELVKGRGSL